MKQQSRLINRLLAVLAWTTAISLVFIMTGFQVWRQDVVYTRHNSLGGVDILFVICFSIILIFIVLSLIRMQWAPVCKVIVQPKRSWLVLAGLVGLVMLAVEKVMIDEIGREFRLGWEVLGEWIILYFCLTFQLFYTLIYYFMAVRNTLND